MARTAVVTAGTGGIGLETALGLTQAGYAVTVVGRNAERGAKAVERINARGGEPAQFLQADLASLDDVRTLATRIPDDVTVLVNNVGAMFEDRTMINGVEATFVVNHLSPYLLTELLLPRLSRVVNVTTGAVTLAKKVFDEIERRHTAHRHRHRSPRPARTTPQSSDPPAHRPRRPQAQREARTTRPGSGWNIQID